MKVERSSVSPSDKNAAVYLGIFLLFCQAALCVESNPPPTRAEEGS
jgi:hypothetical protein